MTQRRKRELEIQEEIQSHLQMAARDRVANGENPRSAAAAAHREFGNVGLTAEVTRAVWVQRWADDLVQDVRYAFRTMRKAPAFTAVALLSLALGIGANTAVFSIFDAVILRPLPVPDHRELFIANRSGVEDTGMNLRFSYPMLMRMQAAVGTDASIAASTRLVRLQVRAGNGPAQSATGQLVSGNWFQVLGITPRAGRLLIPQDDRIGGGAPVVVLSYAYWQRRFAADPSVVSSAIQVNGTPLSVVGVAPQGFFGNSVGEAPDLWVPATLQDQVRHYGDASNDEADLRKPWAPQEGIQWLRLMARSAPDRLGVVEAKLNSAFRTDIERRGRLETDAESRRRVYAERIRLLPGGRGFDDLRGGITRPLTVLMVAVAVVLLITCANLANLLLARANARRKEVAIREAIGAGRARVLRQLMTESVVLSVIGGSAGLLVAQWGSMLLLRMASRGPEPIPIDAGIDWRVLAFAAAVSVATGLLFGMAPALRSVRVQITDSLKAAAGVSGDRSRVSGRKLLVVSQVALSLALLVCAGLLFRTLRNLKGLDGGFDRDRVLTASIDLRAAGVPDTQLPAIHDRLLERVRALPQVQSASLSMYSLNSGSQRLSSIVAGGRPYRPGDIVQENFVASDYFRTVGMQLLAGRDFRVQDGAKTPKVAIVNEAMARHWFGSASPIGKRFGYDGPPNDSTFEIVGVIRNARVNNPRERIPKMVYYPMAQHPQEYLRSIDVRTSADPRLMAAQVRSAIAEVDRNIPVREVITLAEQVDRTLTQERMLTRLTAAFGLVALVLACIGLYGVLSYAVTQRTREIGIRIALGASRGEILRSVFGEGMAVVFAGVIAGAALALSGSRLLESLLYGVQPTDALTLGLAISIFVVVAAVAAFAPARRAAAADPLSALRWE